MRIEGIVRLSGKWWAVEVPLLLVYTQGRSRPKALEMAREAVEDLIDQKGFHINIDPGKGENFSLGTNQESKLMAFALRQQRLGRHLSIRDVAQRLGSRSPTAYSRYESGAVRPSLEKFSQLLCAIDPVLEPILKVG